MAVSGDGKALAVGTAFTGHYSQNRAREMRDPKKRAGLLASGVAFDVSDAGR